MEIENGRDEQLRTTRSSRQWFDRRGLDSDLKSVAAQRTDFEKSRRVDLKYIFREKKTFTELLEEDLNEKKEKKEKNVCFRFIL